MSPSNPLLEQDLDLDRMTIELVYAPDAFERDDASDDRTFYATDRFVSHLDEQALATVRELIGSLVVEDEPVILDLMASWDSHLPEHLRPSLVVGLGLNERELAENGALTERVIHDVNRDPELPFDANTFDVVLNTVSVDYLTRPFELFREVGRVLKPGGLFLVIFSNRFFPPKVVKRWKEATEKERVLIVEDYFKAVGCFEPTTLWTSQGKPRPADDKYADYGLPSDPVYAMFAEKPGGPPKSKPRRTPSVSREDTYAIDEELVARRKKNIAKTLRCPHCNERLSKWEVPQTPFTEHEYEYLYVCFNDRCPYLVRGWEAMSAQGNLGCSYRFMYMREQDFCANLSVPSLMAFKESIVEDDS